MFDRSPGYDRSEGNRTGADLFYVTASPKSMNDDIVMELGELDMTDSACLYEFLRIASEHFPSRHIVLDIWSHGRGTYPDGIVGKGVVEDYSTGYGAAHTMPVADLAAAIARFERESGRRIDVIQFDCCDMQMIEAAYQLRNLTDYVVGAETQIAGSGSDYRAIASYLNRGGFDAGAFAGYLVDSFLEHQGDSALDFSYSAVRTSEFEGFMDVFDGFCGSISGLLDSRPEDAIAARASMCCTDSAYPEFADLWQTIVAFGALGIDVSGMRDRFAELVPFSVANGSCEDAFGGLAVNFPHAVEEVGYYCKEGDYAILDFYADSQWDELLRKFWGFL